MAKNMMIADDLQTNEKEAIQQSRGISTPTPQQTYKPLGTNVDAQVTNQSDINALNLAKAQYGQATNQAQKDAAHAAAEAIRAKYNYSGGGDGSQFIVNQPSAGGGEVKVSTAQHNQTVNDYISLIQEKGRANNDEAYKQQLAIIEQKLKAELEAAGVDTAKIESDYTQQLQSIEGDTYKQLQEQKVNMANRGIGNSQQGIGLEQGVYEGARNVKLKAYVDRNDRINQITSRIATLRSKATTDTLQAGVDKNIANNQMDMALAGKQIDRLIGLETMDKEQAGKLELQGKDFSNQQILEQLRNKYAMTAQKDQQTFEKDILQDKFNNEIKMFNLNAAQQLKLQGLDEQSKIKLMGMENANRKSLMAMDNANKIKLMGMEMDMKEAFFNADAQLQRDLMSDKMNLSKEEMRMEFEMNALKDIPGLAESLVSGASSITNINKATEYYTKLATGLKTIGGGGFKRDAVMEGILSDVTGKSIAEIVLMKPEQVQALLQPKSNEIINKAIQDKIKSLFNTTPKTETNKNYFK